jgi:hypothetical protein
MNVNILTPLIVAAVMGAVIIIASGYSYLQAKLCLLFSGTLVFVLALVQLVREVGLLKHGTDKGEVEDRKPEGEASIVQYGAELLWLAGFGLSIYLLGFIISIPVFICAYMKSHGVRWRTSALTGVLISGFCYVVFVLVLQKELYVGEIFRYWRTSTS